MDRVVSSYTPTIRALAYSRERQAAPSSSTLVVAVPDAPECPPLDSAVLEARAVRGLVPGAAALPAEGAETDRDAVVEALRHHGIAHLVCHGVASWSDPAGSRLILHDHLTSPLTIHDITRLHLENAQLAYLSACSTTDSSPAQVDEATHLTAAFQLAGYRNVIGTLWPISDNIAATVARDVYSVLTSDGTTPPDPGTAAQALHRATRNLRNRTPGLPTRWAAYIHYGV